MNKTIISTSVLALALSACGGGNNSAEFTPPTGVPAVFTNLSAETNNASADLTGTVDVFDLDEGEDSVNSLTDISTTYGTFSISASGDWTYTLDTEDATVAGLAGPDDEITDTIEISSTDGTTADLVITIAGVEVAVTTQVAKITDTSAGDTGELRIVLSDSIAAGKITMRVNKEASDVADFDAFINLSGSSTSRANAMIDLRVNDINGYAFTQSGETINDSANFATFANDTWADVEITWDSSAASGTVAPLITFSIDGQAVTTEAFSSESADLGAIEDGIDNIQFRLGGGSALDDTGAAFYVDDIVVFSDVAGTTEVCSIDFEDSAVGDDLDPPSENTPVASCSMTTPVFSYHTNSFQAVVGEIAAENDL